MCLNLPQIYCNVFLINQYSEYNSYIDILTHDFYLFLLLYSSSFSLCSSNLLKLISYYISFIQVLSIKFETAIVIPYILNEKELPIIISLVYLIHSMNLKYVQMLLIFFMQNDHGA